MTSRFVRSSMLTMSDSSSSRVPNEPVPSTLEQKHMQCRLINGNIKQICLLQLITMKNIRMLRLGGIEYELSKTAITRTLTIIGS